MRAASGFRLQPSAAQLAVGCVLLLSGLMALGAALPVHGQTPDANTPASSTRPSLVDDVAQRSPLAFWPLSDAGGPRVRDLVAGHEGSARGHVRLGQVAQGPSVSSAGFDGGSARITVPADSWAQQAASATAWFRTPRTHSRSGGTLIDTGGLIVKLQSGRVDVGTCVRAGCNWLGGRVGVSDGAWHQVIASLTPGHVAIFVDGVLDSHGPSAGASKPSATGLITIGAGFVGNIDDVGLLGSPVDAAGALAQFQAGACPQASGSMPPDDTTIVAAPPLPLSTQGRFVVDATGRRVKLAGVNWYGAEQLDRVPAGLQCQSVDAIAAHIAADGFNVVRLPWATQTWIGANRWVPPVAVAANPQLRGWGAREVFDAVIDALARHGLLVILDNHVGRPDWCCSTADGNALWWEDYDPAHPPQWARMTRATKRAYFNAGMSRWLAAWTTIAARYSPTGSHPEAAVIGADLRNEPRGDSRLRISPSWSAAKTPVWSDWPRAVTVAGDLVLRANPSILVAVEGLAFATDLRGAASRPIVLSAPQHLLYSVHDYPFTHGTATEPQIRTQLGALWGWLLTEGQSWTTPVWVGEWGTCHPDGSRCLPTEAAWRTALSDYLRDGDVDWSYWSINGTGARGSVEPRSCRETFRFPGCDDWYGLSDDTWSVDASAALTSALRPLQTAVQGP